jgi:hypothetical protein
VKERDVMTNQGRLDLFDDIPLSLADDPEIELLDLDVRAPVGRREPGLELEAPAELLELEAPAELLELEAPDLDQHGGWCGIPCHRPNHPTNQTGE